MTHGSLPDEDSQLRCPYCTLIIERVAVTMAGELIGCESCALERGLSPVVLSLEEWQQGHACRYPLGRDGWPRRTGLGQRKVTKADSQNAAHLQLGFSELNFQLRLRLDFLNDESLELADADQVVEGNRGYNKKENQREDDHAQELDGLSHRWW